MKQAIVYICNMCESEKTYETTKDNIAFAINAAMQANESRGIVEFERGFDAMSPMLVARITHWCREYDQWGMYVLSGFRTVADETSAPPEKRNPTAKAKKH